MKVSDQVVHKKTKQLMTIKRITGNIATCKLRPQDCFHLFPNEKNSPIIDSAVCHVDNLELV